MSDKIAMRVEFTNVLEIWVRNADLDSQPIFCWQKKYLVGSSTLPDSVQRLYGMINENDGENCYLFYCADCFSPPIDLVFADSFEDAYQDYIDFAYEHRFLKIEEEDYADYNIDIKNAAGELVDCTCAWTSEGNPVDTESIQGMECSLIKIVQG